MRFFFCLLFFSLKIGAAWSQVYLETKVEGVKGEVLENVMAYLSIAHQKKDAQLAEGVIHRLYGKAEGEIKTALEVYGYYQPQIEAELQQRPKKWLARYRIDPGPRMRVGKVDLTVTGEGAEDPAFQALQQDFPIKEGEFLNQTHYEQGKSALQRLASERGYFQANFTQQALRINLDTYSSGAVLRFDTGPRYRFGPVTFTETVVRPQLLARYVPFQEGEFYRSSKVVELQTALVDSDYFAVVEVEPHPQRAANLEVPISVYLQAEKHNRYSVGVGFGTNTGPRLNLGWENRYINRYGHRFNFALNTSKINQTFDASYVIPIGNPRTDRVSIASSIGRRSTVTSNSHIALFGIRRIVARPGGWQETLFLDYRLEDFDVGGDSGLAKLLIPGITWFRRQADDPVYPQRGHRVSLELQGAAQELLSNNTFLQFTLQGKIIRSLGRRSRLLVRGDAGTTWVSDFANLPPSVRYFAGGDQSIRGYAFSSLGAINERDRVIGGKNLLVGSVEYEYRFLDKWAAAAFYDAGNAFNDFSSLEVQQGAGVGVRWISPVGPIRVDFAFALSKPGTPFRLHVNLGPDL
ncbi:surface antigen (D15) [Nitrosococcus watsonii C-113]|uniref:Translocation and assembly module subunit TamA n=1 Tax=Nitrosococcus watsoni (strain C-113) TaxID=105559 RepID=D8KAS2_NITWC|nr:surface antigen (D15) [Nitrosococcus watsonii C-113]